MTISNIYRNRTLNEISEGDVGAELKVAGWIENIRDHGGVSFSSAPTSPSLISFKVLLR